jgi:hypothetical protein
MVSSSLSARLQRCTGIAIVLTGVLALAPGVAGARTHHRSHKAHHRAHHRRLTKAAARPEGRVVADTASTNPCVLCVLNPSANGALNVNGGAHLTLAQNGSIYVDSSSSDAADISGGSVVSDTDGTFIVGGWNASGGSIFNPAPQHTSSFSDPISPPIPAAGGNACSQQYDGLADGQAVTGPNTAFTLGGGQGNIYPGTYTSITVSGSAQLMMWPGVYHITQALTVSGQAHLNGYGVELVFDNQAGTHLSGGTSTTLLSCGGFNAMLIEMVPGNTASFTVDNVNTCAYGSDFSNGGCPYFDGEFWAPSAHLQSQAVSVVSDRMVFDTVNVHSGGFLYNIN